MAEIKISALPSGTPKGTDLTPATDTTDTSSAASGTTKKYVRSDEFNFYVTAMGVRTLTACRLATAAALTATYSNGVSGVGATLTNSGAMTALSIDGVAVSANDRILVKNQVTQAQNGIYTVTTIGSGAVNWVLTRATDYDQAADVQQFDVVLVNQGTVNAGLSYQESNAGPFTIGTTDIIFIQFNINNIINPSPAVANKLLRSDGSAWVVSTNASMTSTDILSGISQLNVDNLRLDANTVSSTDTNGNINIIPNGTGWVNIGNSTWNPQALLGVAQSGDNGEIATGSFINSSSGPVNYFYKSRSTSIGSFVTVQAGDTLGQSAFYGDDGTAFRQGAVIKVLADTGIGAGLMPSIINFYTTNTSGVDTLGMTLTSSQALTLANPLLVASGGSGRGTATAYGLIAGGTTATGAHQSIATGTAGQFLTSGGAGALPTWTTATFPATAGSAGTILRSNGTNWVNSTSTFADTYVANTILYASGSNAVSGLTSGTGVITALGQNVTGSGGIVLANGPTFVTSTITAPSITFSTTSGVIGTTTNNNAAAGSAGEYSSSIVASGSAVSLTSATTGNVTSLSLTAGDWDVWGNISFVPAGTTTFTINVAWISTDNSTVPDSSLYCSNIFPVGTTSTSNPGIIAPMVRISLASTTTVYLNAVSVFAVSTMAACGGLFARRRR